MPMTTRTIRVRFGGTAIGRPRSAATATARTEPETNSCRQAQPVQEQSAAGGDKKGLGKARETAERHGLRTDPRL